MSRVTVLSLENTKKWSWGVVIGYMKRRLNVEMVRTVREEYYCPNPRCRTVYRRELDPELAEHFDLILPQNVDAIRLVPEDQKHKVVARLGGLDMSNPENDRYNDEISKVGYVIATNKQLGDIARKVNGNVVEIPNGVDLDLFKPTDPCPNFDRAFTIGFAGNIHGAGADYKGWKPFIEAYIALAPYGVQQHHMLHKAKQVPHEDMPEKFYNLIDALILPSRGEGCSNVISEALASGVPCLLTKVGFHGEMLQDGVNCLFIERDAADIAAKVRRLIDEPELRTQLSVAGRKFAEEYHDVRKVAQAYDDVFQAVLAANSAAER